MTYTKRLFSTAAVLNLLLGVLWLLNTPGMVSRWQVPSDAVLAYALHRYAVLFFGYAHILWRTRKLPSVEAQRAIMGGSLIVCTGLAGVSSAGVLSATIAISGWLSATIEGALAIGFALGLWLTRRSRC